MSDAATFSFCEGSWATAISPTHIRRVGPEGLMPGGGVQVLTLCGRVFGNGWDVRPVDADRDRPGLPGRYSIPRGTPGHTCVRCQTAWLSTVGR